MATLQCVQYGTGRPSAPRDDGKTAAASFIQIMPNRLAASSVLELYHSGPTAVVLSKVRKQVFEDSTEAAYIFTYEGSHWLRYLIGCAASPLARPSLAHACEVPFPYRGPRTVLLIALTSTPRV